MNKLLTPKEVSERLGVSLTTLWRWRRKKILLSYIKLGKSIRYKEEEVNHYLNTIF